MAPMWSLVFPTLFLSALAAPLGFGSAAVKELIKLPPGWTQIGVPLPTDPLKLSFALKQSNIDGLIAKLHDIADPDSPNFRQWLTPEQVASYSAPEPATISNVTSWLTSHGIQGSSIHQTIDMLQVTTTVAQAELLLGATYLLYDHPLADAPVPRALTYSLPGSLFNLVDTVQPTTAFVIRNSALPLGGSATADDLPTAVDEKRAAAATCDPSKVFPACVLAKYKSDWVGGNRAGAQTATYGGSNPANHTDGDLYKKLINSNAPSFQDITVDGGKNSGAANEEGNLDTQINLGMAANNAAYYITSPAGSDFFLELTNYLQSSSAPPAVSVSYGGNEGSYSVSYMQRVCNGFAQAGSQGISVFVASGDDGVGGFQGSGSCSTFLPAFPPNCPYVTAVGATVFVNSSPFVPNSSGDQGESVALYGTNGGSGGGFSNVFAQPSFQSSAVKTYISRLNGQNSGSYNASGRAYPDVSAIGYSWYNVINGVNTPTYGTSCSSPAFAGIASLINDYRISAGKAKLGWVNPAFYKNPGFFTDITRGSNRGCNGNGFPALAGWDAATGLGTPIIPSLRTGL